MSKLSRSSSALTEKLESRLFFSTSPASIIPHLHRPTKLGSEPASPALVENGTGITGEYFASTTYTNPVVVRNDSDIDFYWPSGRPDQDVPAGGFSARWTGLVEAPTTGPYTFYTSSDYNTLLTINGSVVINHPGEGIASGSVLLTAGQPVSFELDYVSRNRGASRVELSWSAVNMSERVVPKSALSPATLALPPEALTGYYYIGASFNKLVMTRADSSINFNWGEGVPDQVIPLNTPFSVRWIGVISVPTTGKYTFETITDDGVRLWVNGIEIVHDWHVHSAQSDLGKITLQAGQTYAIRMDYFQNGIGHTSAKLFSALPGRGRNEKFVHFLPPPAAPTDVTANPFSSTQIDLSWNDVANETGFLVERSGDGGATFTQIATTAKGVTVYDDTGLTPGTEYEYKIIALDAAGQGSPSTAATGATLPGLPAAVVASATDIGTTATVSWNAATGATSYVIERSLNASTGFTTLATTSATTYMDTGLTIGTTYYYTVTGVDAVGSGPVSNVVSIVAVPAAPVLTASVITPTQIDLHWNNVTGEAGFKVFEASSAAGPFTQIANTSTGVTSFSVGGLTPSTPYYFTVEAISAGGNSAMSNAAEATTTVANPTTAALTILYGVTSGGLVYSINVTTGAATQIGTLLFGSDAAGRDPYTSNIFYVSSGSTAEIAEWNPNDGANTILNASVPLDNSTAQVAFRADGEGFLTTALGDLYEFNSDTGDATLLGTLQAGGSTLTTGNGDMAFSSNNTLYIETATGSESDLYSVSAAAVAGATGSGSIISATEVGPTVAGYMQIAFGQNGVLYGTDTSGQLYTVNTSTGAATAVGTPSGLDMNDLASDPLYSEVTSTLATTGSFVRNTNGAYTITVNNTGPDTTVSEITLVDTLPAGVTFVSGAGTGWTFVSSGSTVTMTYVPNLAAGAAAPVVTVNVAIGASAASSVVETVVTSTNEFQINTANNTSSLTSSVTG